MPYCEPHYPKTVASVVNDTPEMRRIAENTKNQSQIAYHAEYEKMKGTKIEVADDPETIRHKQNTHTQSSVAYHGDLEKKNRYEAVRPKEVPGDESRVVWRERVVKSNGVGGVHYGKELWRIEKDDEDETEPLSFEEPEFDRQAEVDTGFEWRRGETSDSSLENITELITDNSKKKEAEKAEEAPKVEPPKADDKTKPKTTAFGAKGKEKEAPVPAVPTTKPPEDKKASTVKRFAPKKEPVVPEPEPKPTPAGAPEDARKVFRKNRYGA
ncbi:hypothetical protein WR25_08634 [Diploscapter pachys]|uniref:Uncharacterized protein n=1 Tax=Diploscapter pachys TaxID=2018661 RepID=A0A2A2JUK0_9BILA|nr:hypothetical protein WR25_08634 [Diploscapter pachys]